MNESTDNSKSAFKTASGIWPIEDPTVALLELVKSGDADAMNRLLERYRPAVRRLIRYRLDRAISQRVDASDVVQDVLLEASQRLPEFLKGPPLPFHLWLRQLARDRLIDMHRRHRQAQRRSVDREQAVTMLFPDRSSIQLAGELQDQELTPAAANIRRELEHRFRDALECLDEDDRDIIVMRHFEQLGNQEAALALGLSPAAAGMRHLRALRRLKTILASVPHFNSLGSQD